MVVQTELTSARNASRADDTLDTALRVRYAATLVTADDYREVVRTAAIEWVREVRRSVGDSLHTRVESLHDSDCSELHGREQKLSPDNSTSRTSDIAGPRPYSVRAGTALLWCKGMRHGSFLLLLAALLGAWPEQLRSHDEEGGTWQRV